MLSSWKSGCAVPFPPQDLVVHVNLSHLSHNTRIPWAGIHITWVYFWALYSFPLISVFVVMPVSGYFNYCGLQKYYYMIQHWKLWCLKKDTETEQSSIHLILVNLMFTVGVIHVILYFLVKQNQVCFKVPKTGGPLKQMKLWCICSGYMCKSTSYCRPSQTPKGRTCQIPQNRW